MQVNAIGNVPSKNKAINLIIDIKIEEKLWRAEDPKIKNQISLLIKEITLQTALASLISKNLQIEIGVVLSNDAKIAELNLLHRGKNKPTNVLSFPANDVSKIKNGNLKKVLIIGDFLPLGDIVLAYQTIKREAEEQSKEFKNHLTHLIIHGLLHLIGYDHMGEKDATIMESLEVSLLKKLDIDNPYIILVGED